MSSGRRRRKRNRSRGGEVVGRRAGTEAAATDLGNGPRRSLAGFLFSGTALWLTLGLIAITLAVYSPVWRYGFVTWDDPQYVSQNPWVQGGFGWPAFRWAFTIGQAGLWIPLTWLSYMLDIQLYGQGAGGHHFTNLLLHIANTLLLFALLRRMTGALGRSALVAALFAVHPLHVESVAWVTERKDVLSTFFGLLALWAWVDYVRLPRRGPYLWALALFALGLMAKPMLVTLPFLLLLLDVWPLRRASAGAPSRPSPDRSGVRARSAVVWHLLSEKTPFMAIALASSIVTYVAQRHAGAVSGLEAISLDSRLANALVSYVAYIFQMLWPARLAGLYPYKDLPAVWVLGSAALLVGISGWFLQRARRSPWLPVGWFWFLGSLLPVIGLVQVGVQARADRFTYIPLIGLFIVIAWGVPDLLARMRHRDSAMLAASGLVIAACMAIARTQVRTWKDSLTFWQHTVDVTSENARARGNLGSVLAGLGRDEEAIAQYEEALRISPGLADVHNNFANTLAEQGRSEEAIAHYTEALRLKPDYVSAHNGIGSVLDDQGRFDEAIGHYVSALRNEPGSAMIHNNLAATLAKQGRLEEALDHVLAAVSAEPGDADFHYNAAIILERLGRESEAVPHLETVLELDPGNAEARQLLNTVLGQPR